MTQEEVKPSLASLVAEMAREECRKLYEKRLKSLEEELEIRQVEGIKARHGLLIRRF